MREPADRLSRIIGYRFTDPSLLEQALTHRSAGPVNNERQEFLGDAILGFIVADALYRRFPDASEGDLSRLRARLVKKESLARLARDLGLGDFLHLGAGELRSGGQSRDSILADALEALFAAIYLDGGYGATRETVLRLFRPSLESLPANAREKDPKTRLQEWLQSRRLPLPDYRIEQVSGRQHEQLFIVECRVDGLGLSSRGRGGSRRKAEQDAAENLLQAIRQGGHESG